MQELVAELSAPSGADPLIRAAMAHLNLVMIHPFRDGNGRMARALQAHGLPERTTAELYDATLGFRIRRASYVKRASIEERTASRDLARLVDLELLSGIGQTKGRHYAAGPKLKDLRLKVINSRTPIIDPYPWMSARLRTSPQQG